MGKGICGHSFTGEDTHISADFRVSTEWTAPATTLVAHFPDVLVDVSVSAHTSARAPDIAAYKLGTTLLAASCAPRLATG
ncbi:MAG: hypothetical protein NVS4B12_13100 [Ktedonobacteraceae bacterium]